MAVYHLSYPGHHEGFRATLSGATLADLIQMECSTRARGMARIISSAGVGNLWFRDGEIVHAVLGAMSGEAAALELLQWREGTFETFEGEAPVRETIATSWQSLLLRAAQLEDESGQKRLVGVSSRPERVSHIRKLEVESEGAMEVPRSQANGAKLMGSEIDVAVRIGPGGTILSSKNASEELAQVAAYAWRLAELTGTMLGMEGLAALECGGPSGSLFLLSDEEAVVAFQPAPDVDLRSLRERLQLG